MEFVLSNRIANVTPSAIREILKLTADPNIIPFSAGNPSQEAFPVEEVRRWTAELLEKDPILALQYSQSEGHPAFREKVRRFLRERYNSGTQQDDIIVTTGAEQALDLVTKVLCNEGDYVLCEAPSFVGALNTFRSYGAKLLGVEMEQDGIDLAKLEKTLQSHKKIKFMYLIPNFQNPSGITMSVEKRKQVLALSVKYNVPIVEDNPYGDLRFAGEHLPTIKSMDNTDNVIYVGSFSKVLSPGLRVAYLCTPKALMPKMTVAKQCTDVHTPILNQLLCEKFLDEVDFDAHIKRCSEIYRKKYLLMAETIERTFSKKVHVTKPEGGLFLWATLPDGIDIMDFCKRAIERGVAVVPGTAFMMEESDISTSFRLNYSTPSEEKIVKGIEILGQLTKELLD